MFLRRSSLTKSLNLKSRILQNRSQKHAFHTSNITRSILKAQEDLILNIKEEVATIQSELVENDESIKEINTTRGWTVEYLEDKVKMEKVEGEYNLKIYLFPEEEDVTAQEQQEEDIQEDDDIEGQDAAEEDEDFGVDSQDYFEVFVTKTSKSDKAIKFSIWGSSTDGMDVRLITYVNGTNKTDYEFDDLPKSTKDAIFVWMDELGLDDELCELVDLLCTNFDTKKEQVFLSHIQNFLE